MDLYRAVGLQELGAIYDSKMKVFPVGSSQQPVFYPVFQMEYARQVASHWNSKSGESAGYVVQWKVDDQYISRFEEHAVGDTPYQELWIPVEELDEFNKHIIGSIKTLEAHFGEGFLGFVPENFGLKGKNAIEQFTMLANTYLYKRMDFYLEIRRNHKAVYLNYPFWQKYNFKNTGLKEKMLQAVKEAWMTSFPQIPLVMNPVQEEIIPAQQQDSSPAANQFDDEEDEPAERSDIQPLGTSVWDNDPLIEQPGSTSLMLPEQEYVSPAKPIVPSRPVEPHHEQIKVINEPDSYYRQGIEFGLLGSYQEAVDALSRTVEADAQHGTAYTSLGVAYHRLGEDDRALSCYEAALQIDPKSADAHYFRANILYSRGAVREAIADYMIAIGLEPKLIEAHNASHSRDRLTDYTSVPSEIYWIAKAARRILVLDELIEANPRDASLLKERAGEYSRLWNYERAVEDYSSSLELQPGDASAFHLRGVAYEQLGQQERAFQDYQQAVKINPRLAEAYIDRGIAHANAGNFRQAVASLTEGIRFVPRDPNVYFNRGMSFFQGRDLESAIEDFSRVIQLSPEDEEAFYWRGISYEEVGRLRDAVADYKRFLELSQNQPARDDVEQRLRRWENLA